MKKYIKPEIDVIEVTPTRIMDASLTKEVDGEKTESYLGKESGDDMSWSDESED